MIATINNGALCIGRDFVEAVAGPYRTQGGATVNNRVYPVRSALGCSDTSDAIIRLARRERVRLSDHWTQALEMGAAS